MALRAGYYGLKRFERNKLSILAASMPADISPDNPIASKSDISATVDLMKDTTGWLGGNECVNNAVSKTENGVTWTVNADKSISAYGQPIEGDAYIDVNAGANVSANGVAWICNGCPSGGANDKYYSQLRLSNPNGTWYGARTDTGNGYQLSEAEVTANVKTQYRCIIPSGAPAIPQSSPIVFRPMIISPEQYALNPSYRPYHESVEEMLQNKVGDTIYLNHCILSGYVTSSGSDIFVTLPFKCSTISGITVDANCIVNARGNSGYIKDSAGTDISGSYKFASNLKWSQILQGNNGITSLVIKNIDDNAFTNVTNNTPVVIELLGNITLTDGTVFSIHELSEPEPATKKATKRR